MSESPANFSFPHRTPVFTAVIVLLCFAVFGWLAMKIYLPHAYAVDKVEGVKTPAERKALLAEHRAKELAESTTYGWVDQKAGTVRLPIEPAFRHLELPLRIHSAQRTIRSAQRLEVRMLTSRRLLLPPIRSDVPS